MSETVTVRMSRSDRNTSWGFGCTEGDRGEVVIVNVVGGSLADRAGLRNGDVLDELENLGNLDMQAVDRLLVTARDKIELVVHRNGSGQPQQTRVWRPEITLDGPPAQQTVRVNLQHNGDTVPPKGFNSAALPFDTDPRVKHNQYNSPLGLYSASNAVEQYNQQTAGVLGNDSKVSAGQQQPGYLRSETLRLLQEQEKPAHTLSSHPNPSGLPLCYVCGRAILGVMARAAGHDVHGDCLSCATCGNSLRNVGHHFIDGKFYCDVHGSQRKGGFNAPSGRSSINPDLAVRSTPTAAQPFRQPEPPRASYQPEVMSRRPLSVSPTPPHVNTSSSHVSSHTTWGTPKTQGTISPAARGVPTSHSFGDHSHQHNHRTTSNYQSNSMNSLGAQMQQLNVSAPPPLPSQPPPGSPFQQQQQQFQRTETTRTSNTSLGNANNAQYGQQQKGQLSQTSTGGRVPFCEACKQQIRGAFVLAAGQAWCPEHFVCENAQCGRRLLECGFVEEAGRKYCEGCFERHIAPRCAKCSNAIVSDCLNALQKKWHPGCFTCAHCAKPFGNAAFYLEQGLPYCEKDWNALFTTKCVSCRFPIEAGDRWVEALGQAYHSNCFCCSRCNCNLEGESFYAKNGQPFCKQHA